MCELVVRNKTVDNTDKYCWFHRRIRIFQWIIILEDFFLTRINSDFIPAFVTPHKMWIRYLLMQWDWRLQFLMYLLNV